MNDDKPIVYIHCDRDCDHCWVYVMGPALSHPVKIRRGLYSENVSAAIVASEVTTLADGKVKVQVV